MASSEGIALRHQRARKARGWLGMMMMMVGIRMMMMSSRRLDPFTPVVGVGVVALHPFVGPQRPLATVMWGLPLSARAGWWLPRPFQPAASLWAGRFRERPHEPARPGDRARDTGRGLSVPRPPFSGATTTTTSTSTFSRTPASGTTPRPGARRSSNSRTTTNANAAAAAADRIRRRRRPLHVVIVESPSKCSTLQTILQEYAAQQGWPQEFRVTACRGHVRNLPSSSSTTTIRRPSRRGRRTESASSHLPSNETTSSAWQFPYAVPGVRLPMEDQQPPPPLEQWYTPEYTLIPSQAAVLRELEQLVHQADHVWIATDPDREGEAMAWHLQQVLQLVEQPPPPPPPTTTTAQLEKEEEEDFTSSSSSSSLSYPSSASSSNSQKKSFQRISFTEITPTAVIQALEHPVLLNPHLVMAQETRRVLDRLAGFTVSPLLWKKVAAGLSAGRVQSVAMALVVQRERERLTFEATEYWTLDATLKLGTEAKSGGTILATVQSVNGTTVAASGQDFTATGRQLRPESSHKWQIQREDAEYLTQRLSLPDTTWTVRSVLKKPRQQSPPLPYKTSTLQQDASRRLGISVEQTMRLAQQLYEQGLISYMRTDSTTLSEDARRTLEQTVAQKFGAHLVDSQAPSGGGKRKKGPNSDRFAQEAHEAIRPAIQSSGTMIEPGQIDGSISDPCRRLYQLIYQRSLACRMQPLITNVTQVMIEGLTADGETRAQFRASGSVVISPGYTLALRRLAEDDDDDDGEDNQQLPSLSKGQSLQLHEMIPIGHETQPPARFTEASLVKELEAVGVGRPSTYSKIVQLLKHRAYVGQPSPGKDPSPNRSHRKPVSGATISAVRAAGGADFTGENSARGPLAPSLTAFVVCALFEQHCPSLVDPHFTAKMEDRLDEIASGEKATNADRVAYLNDFYAGENGLAQQIKRVDDMVDADDLRRAKLPALLQGHSDADGTDVGLFVGPWGPYVRTLSPAKGDQKAVTVPLPPSMAADLSTITPTALKALLSVNQDGGIVLGHHPDDGRTIRFKIGRYGPYLQWGDDGENNTTTHSLPKSRSAFRGLDIVEDEIDDLTELSVESMIGVSLDEAIACVNLPRTVTTVNDLPVIASQGPYGPYLKYNNSYVNLKNHNVDVLTIDAEVAERLVLDEIINKGPRRGRGVVAELGEKDGSPVTVKRSRWGFYVYWKKLTANLPAAFADKPSDFPLEDALVLLEKSKEPSKGPGRRRSAVKSSDENGTVLPPAPKKPLSAYLHFCAENRANVAASTKSLGEVSKKLSELWAKCSVEERAKYELMAAEGKEQYETVKAAWQEECSKIQSTSSRTTTRESSGKPRTSFQSSDESALNLPPPPKKPLTAYLHFCAEKRPEVASSVKSLGEVSKRLADLWAKTPAGERSKYVSMAAESKEKYEGERLAWIEECDRVQSNQSDSTTAAKSASTKQRAPSAYMLFCREYRPTVVDENGAKLPFVESTKKLASMWKDLDDASREKFQKLAAAEKESLQW